MTWIQTLDGKKFDLLNPRPEDISPITVCTSLSRLCRFGGHCREFYSVGQHSLLVESMILSDELRLPALLHDAHEAFWGFGDILRPAKRLNDGVRVFLEQRARHIDAIIALRFGFDASLFSRYEIKLADNRALATEARDLMADPPCPWERLPKPHAGTIVPMSDKEACQRFAYRLNQLWQEQN